MASYDIIQHLHGTPEQWEQHDIVIPDAELAIENQPDGTRKVKIGNGVNKWSELDYSFIPVSSGEYNDWYKIWDVVCDGTKSIYTFSTNYLGKPFSYSEIHYEITCPAAAKSTTSNIYFNPTFSVYITETTLPTTSTLFHGFQLDFQRERMYRAKGIPGGQAALNAGRIFNESGTPIGDVSYICMLTTNGMNYPEGSVITIWGR